MGAQGKLAGIYTIFVQVRYNMARIHWPTPVSNVDKGLRPECIFLSNLSPSGETLLCPTVTATFLQPLLTCSCQVEGGARG